MPVPARVFLSYARKDGETFATALRRRLSAEAPEITVWQDRAELEGGVGWWTQIESALDQVQFLVIIMTPLALESEITLREWRYARRRYSPEGAEDRRVVRLHQTADVLRREMAVDPSIAASVDQVRKLGDVCLADGQRCLPCGVRRSEFRRESVVACGVKHTRSYRPIGARRSEPDRAIGAGSRLQARGSRRAG